MKIDLLKIADFNNDFNKFVDACYSCYLSIWKSQVMFNDKIIIRNSFLERNKEKDFWGIVEGHNDDKVFDNLARYETMPFLKHILENLSKTKNDENSDIFWFYSERRKVNIVSKKLKYFIVLKESGGSKFYFVTSYPISDNKVIKIGKKWKEYWETNIRSN